MSDVIRLRRYYIYFYAKTFLEKTTSYKKVGFAWRFFQGVLCLLIPLDVPYCGHHGLLLDVM